MIRRLRTWTFRDWVVSILVIAFAVAVAWIYNAINVRNAQVDALTTALAEEQEATRKRGGRPVAPNPSEIIKDPSLRGDDGRGIIATTTDGCYVRLRFTDDTDRRVGPFCGEDGTDGEDGEPGKPGATGAPGVSITGVTTDGCMILISLSNGESVTAGPFCGRDGEDGTDGEDGKPGRGIEDTQCELRNGEYRWHIWYDDGTEKEDAGPCYKDKPELPAPSPAPTPS